MGSYKCSCQVIGYSLDNDKHNCSGKLLLLNDSYDCYVMTLQISMSVILIMEAVNKYVLIQYHYLIVLASLASDWLMINFVQVLYYSKMLDIYINSTHRH